MDRAKHEDTNDEAGRPAKRIRLATNGPLDPHVSVLFARAAAFHRLMRPQTLATSEEAEHAKELQNGITEFVRPNAPGFSGILKYRYTDFQVHEVQEDATVTYLKQLRRPKKTKAKTEKEAAPTATEHTEQATPKDTSAENGENGEKGEEPEVVLSDEDRSRLVSIFGEELIHPILSLQKAILKHPDRRPRDFKPVRSNPIPEKDARTEAHQAIRQIFHSGLETQTREEDNTIEIKKPPTRPQKRGGGYEKDGVRVSGAQMWEELGGEHTHFTLYKENRDTMEVLGYISGRLKVNMKSFSFGGTKDRRAVTTQRVSAYRLHAVKFEQLTAQTRGCAFGDFENKHTPCQLGDIGGNHFTITLRACHFPGEENLDMDGRVALANSTLQTAIPSFEQLGFINYFGLQRFGSYAISTDEIGKKMLQGDFKAAVDAILDFDQRTAEASPEDERDGSKTSEADIQRAQAISMFREDPAKAQDCLKLMPKKFSAERAIITHLGRRDKSKGNFPDVEDFQGGLSKITRHLRTMYVHAYQSLVWNHMAGARLKRYGPVVVEGDLILIPKQSEIQTGPEVDEDGEAIMQPADEDRGQTIDDFDRARPLSKAEADGGKYSIFDLVLPLPGWDVILPSNELKQDYETFMASERGGGLDPHNMRRQWKEISLSGGYRKVFSRPGPGVEYEVKVYESDQQDLVETDLEKIRRSEGKAQEKEPPLILKEDSMDEHRMIAVILKFQLGTSQYATMALRELCGEKGVRPYQPDYAGR